MLEDNPVGDMIFQQLELLNMDLYQFAEDMSLTLEEAKELKDGKKLIDGCTALKLERVLGIPTTIGYTLHRNVRVSKFAYSHNSSSYKTSSFIFYSILRFYLMGLRRNAYG